MRRRVAKFVFVVLNGTIAMLLGVVTSMTLTPPGRALLARTVSTMLGRIVHGYVQVGAISGSFIYDLSLENLVVRDTSGALLADLPRVRAGYRLPNFLAGQVVLSSLYLERPTIHLIKHRNGRMNYEDVLGLGKGAPGGTSPLVEFRQVVVDSGTLSIATPWSPPREARTSVARDSALKAERAKPGRVISGSPEGLRKVITLADLTTRMSRLRIATPDHKPFTIDLDSLSTRVNDPAVTLTDAAGRVRIRGDSAVVSLERGALPNTRFSGGGAVTWPADTTLFDFQVIAPRVDLADLRWVSPDFPAMRGSGVLTAKSENGERTAYDIRELHLQGAQGRVDGDVIALTDHRHGFGVRDMNLRLRDLDLDAVRPYVDTLPFYGTLTGTARGTGFLDALDLTVDWAFADAKVPGNPVTTIAGAGRVGATRADGLTFTGFEIKRSDIDLHTVRRIAPAVILDGRLAAVGTLDGPLRNATFHGTADHRDGARPVSHAEGMVRLDTRGKTVGLVTDVMLDPLSFDGIRPAFPSLKSRGSLRGRFVSQGTLSRLAVDASLTGEIGDVEAHGIVTLLPPKWGAEDLLLRFSRLDLAALTGRERVPTSLNGQLRTTGSIDTLRAPEGRLDLALGRSLVKDVTLDTVHTIAQVHDSVLTIDTAYAAMRGAHASGSGTLGWAGPHTGNMRFTAIADNLVGFDTLLLANFGLQRDTASDARPLGGRGRSTILLAGNLDSLSASGDFVGEALEWQRYRSPRVTGTFAWAGGARPSLSAGMSADSISAGAWSFKQAGLQVRGWTDSLDWSAGAGFTPAPAPDATDRDLASVRSRIDGAGSWWRSGSAQMLTFDSLAATMPAHTYRLQRPISLTVSDSAPALTPLALEATDGSSVIRMGGRIPGKAPGNLDVHVLGLDLRDIYAALQRDTADIGGQLSLDLQVAGTAESPTIKGGGKLNGARFREFRAPFIESTINYANRQLDDTLRIWRTGERLLDIDARLPLDLGLNAKRRQIDGQLAVRAHADSVDLGILEAVTPAVRAVRGRLSGDVQVGGTWSSPRLQGSVAVHDAGVTVPGLGVRFDDIGGIAELQGDSVLLRDVKLASGGGTLRVGGSVRLANLSQPRLALELRASRFLAMNVRNLGTLTASSQSLRLRGPIFGATLSGSLTADEGVIYFADLVNKRVLDLDDPTIADLVDTTLIRRENLGTAFQNRFLDSLRMDNVQVQLGSSVWLRSAEANVQLGGTVQVSKAGRDYRPSGTINAVRGSYTLKIGPVTRDFTVQEGTVRYEGNINAALDIRAQHDVRSVRDEDIPVMARIQGQLYAPKLTLESTIRPPISETDLVSYLVTGRPASEASQFTQGAAALQAGLAYFSSAFSSELERALIQDLRLPLSLIEIRPGFAVGNNNTTLTQLAAGWQIGRKTFLTFNAGFCPDRVQVSDQNLGVSLEFRFSHEWRLQSSFEPTLQTCGPVTNSLIPPGRQFGTDIFWEREF